jgi:LysM repeat protein
MSTTIATRTSRVAPVSDQPSDPARKPVRRPADRARSARVGQGDRPVLRIVVSRPTPIEQVEQVEQMAPAVAPVAPVAPCEPAGASRRIDLTDFFAPDYDGDDVSVQIVRPRAGTLRLTRRGRVVVLVAGLATALSLGFVAATQTFADNHPQPTRGIVVQPGQTLWDIAAAQTPSGDDVRSTMTHLEQLNHLDSAALQVGQHLRIPR